MSEGNFKPFKFLFAGVGTAFLVVLLAHWLVGLVGHIHLQPWNSWTISDEDFKRLVVILLVVIAVKNK